jgi:hypothetical protein
MEIRLKVLRQQVVREGEMKDERRDRQSQVGEGEAEVRQVQGVEGACTWALGPLPLDPGGSKRGLSSPDWLGCVGGGGMVTIVMTHYYLSSESCEHTDIVDNDGLKQGGKILAVCAQGR